MHRRSHVWQVALLGLVIGCGEATRSEISSRKKTPEATAAVEPQSLTSRVATSTYRQQGEDDVERRDSGAVWIRHQ